jgi:hypothetical protein
VTLPADPRPAAPSLDLGPVALLLAALSVLTHSPPRSEAVPLQVTVPLAAAALLLMLWAHHRVDRRGSAAHAGVLMAALLLGGTDAILSTLTMRNVATDHLARFPFLLFLDWFGPLCVVYWRDLSSRTRWLAVGGAAAVVGVGFALMPEVPPLSNLAVSAVWPATTLLASLRLRDMLARDERDVADGLERRERTAVDAAYRRGRLLVVDLVAAAKDDARAAYCDVRGGLPEDVATEFERRLSEVDARLAAIRVAEEPSTTAPAPVAPGRREDRRSMVADFRHLIVRGGGRRLDLVLPANAAVGDLLPALVELCGLPPGAEWALGRSGEERLAPTSSLAEAGVVEHEVLHLVDTRAAPPARGAAAIIDRAVESTASWTRRSTEWLVAGLAAGTLLVAVALAVWTRAVRDQAGLSALLLACALLAAGIGLRSRRAGSHGGPAPLALAAAASALAGLGGWGLAGASPDAAGLAAASAGLALAAAAGYPAAPRLAPGGALGAGVLAGAAAAVAAGASRAAVAALVAVAGVVALRLLPRAIGLLLWAVVARPGGRVGPSGLELSARRCRELLVSLSVGVNAAALGGILALLAWGDRLGVVLALVVAVSLLLQARTYRYAPDVLPPALAAGAGLVAMAGMLGLRSIIAGGDPVVPVAALVGLCVALVAVAAAWPELPAPPALPAETWLLVDLALAPLALAELGVFGGIVQAVRLLLH